MKRAMILMLLASISGYGASHLRYVDGKTYTRNEKDYIMYKKNTARKVSQNDPVGVFDGTLDLDEITRLSGLPAPRVWYYPGAEKAQFQKARRDTSSPNHLSTMYRAFVMGAGADWTAKNFGRMYTTSLQGENPLEMPYGIAQSSLAITNDYSGHIMGDAPYYGDVINEMSAIPLAGRRMLDAEYTENGNLFIQAAENEAPVSSVNLQKNSGNAKRSLVNLDNWTAVSSGYGPEARKLMRAESINVYQQICGGWGRGWNEGSPYSDSWMDVTTSASGSTVMDFYDREGGLRNGKFAKMVEHGYAKNKCVISSERSDVASFPLLARAHSVLSSGQVWNGEKVTNGTSYAAPKVAGLAARLQEKFPGMSYHQIKQIILTTASRKEDRLSSFTGWGAVDIDKAMKGPSMLNAGLIEEEKFFTGMYDKVMAKDGVKFFWAEVPENVSWEWSNDIHIGFKAKPSGYDVFDMALTGEAPEGRITSAMTRASVVEGVNVARYVPDEKNFYYDVNDMETRAGLRKAGKGVLRISGKLDYREVTQVLEGKLELSGDSESEIRVFSGAAFEALGKRYIRSLILDGGKIRISGDARIEHFGIDSGDLEVSGKVSVGTLYVKDKSEERKWSSKGIKYEKVVYRGFDPVDALINPRKVANIKHEYFMNNFSSSPLLSGIQDIDKDSVMAGIRKRYMKNSESPYRAYVPGYRDGGFAADRDRDAERFNHRYYLGGTMWYMGFGSNLESTGKNWQMVNWTDVKDKFKSYE